MSATTVQRAPSNATAAEFRAWGKAISDIMAAGGWVLALTTIDWATVAAPTTAGQIMGYEIWRSNDGGVGKNEIFVKLEYGFLAASTSSVQVYFTVGFGHDGAGNITGFATTRANMFGNVGQSSTLYNCNLSAGPGYCCLLMFNTVTNAGILSIERTVNSSGVENNEILVIYAAGAAIPSSQVIHPTEGSFPLASGAAPNALINQSQAIQSGKVGFSLMFGQRGGLTSPSKNVFGSTIANIGGAQTTFVMPVNGVNRTYIVNAATPNFATSVIMLTRFE